MHFIKIYHSSLRPYYFLINYLGYYFMFSMQFMDDFNLKLHKNYLSSIN